MDMKDVMLCPASVVPGGKGPRGTEWIFNESSETVGFGIDFFSTNTVKARNASSEKQSISPPAVLLARYSGKSEPGTIDRKPRLQKVSRAVNAHSLVSDFRATTCLFTSRGNAASSPPHIAQKRSTIQHLHHKTQLCDNGRKHRLRRISHAHRSGP